MAWKACNNLSKIWKTNLSKNIMFQSTVESALLYGSETWTVTKKIGKALDGCYTRMLRAALDISWKSHITNRELYGDIPKITAKITNRRLRFAGHCKRRKGSVVSNLITWQPTQGKRTAGRPTKTYVDQLQADTGYTNGEIESCMENRNLWRAVIGVRQMTREWVSEPYIFGLHKLRTEELSPTAARWQVLGLQWNSKNEDKEKKLVTYFMWLYFNIFL